jgi:hypothetical protein
MISLSRSFACEADRLAGAGSRKSMRRGAIEILPPNGARLSALLEPLSRQRDTRLGLRERRKGAAAYRGSSFDGKPRPRVVPQEPKHQTNYTVMLTLFSGALQ